MGVMSSSVYSPRDHVEESLPLPRGCIVPVKDMNNQMRVMLSV